ncbi:type III PLP-dependent enzyme [Salinicola corii]|nr:type III PLP-dependent enzyme [Salinicola corii]
MPELSDSVRQAILDRRESLGEPMAAFFYDLAALAAHAETVKRALPVGVELFYAIKANSEPAILDTLAPIVDGFELSSGGELERAAECRQRLPWVLSGPGKLDTDLRRALELGVEAIHVESLGEIERLAHIADRLGRDQSVFLRVNPELPEAFSTRLNMAGSATPFGLDETDLPSAIALVAASTHLHLHGFHVHAMSHQKSVERHCALMDLLLEKWEQWCALLGPDTRPTHLNVGGGIGVDYLTDTRFNWPALCAHLETRLASLESPPRVRFEIGRYLSAFCGFYAVEVLDRKTSHGEHFLICRGGTHHFRLPAAQGHDHPVIHLPRHRDSANGDPQRFNVVGQLCTPKDVFSRACWLRDIEVGDLLVLPLAGAYGYNISHADFLCHPRPPLFFLSNAPEAAPDVGLSKKPGVAPGLKTTSGVPETP